MEKKKELRRRDETGYATSEKPERARRVQESKNRVQVTEQINSFRTFRALKKI
jgi:hypothetical protein